MFLSKLSLFIIAILLSAVGFTQSITPAGPISFCEGGSAVLTSTGAPTGSTYQWRKDGSDIAGATLSTYTARLAGSYEVVVTTAGVPATYTAVVVTVNVKPIANFTFNQVSPCFSVPVQFTSTSTGTGLTYTWNFGDPNAGPDNVSTDPNPVHRYIGANLGGSQSFIVTLTVRNSFSCDSSVSKIITFNQPSSKLGGPDFLAPNIFTNCSSSPSNFIFQNLSATAATNTSYQIIWGDGSSDLNLTTFTSTTHSYATGNYALNFIVTGANGCKDTGVYRIFVGSNPGGSISSPSSTQGCTGETFSFPFANVSTNPIGTIYVVSVNDGSKPDTFYQPPPAFYTHTFNKTSCGTGTNNTFTVSYTISNPCSETPGSIGGIRISQKPAPAFSFSKDTACVNTPVTLINTSPATTSVSGSLCTPGKVVWKISPATGWSITSGSLGSDNNSNVISDWTNGTDLVGITFNTPGTYSVLLKLASNGSCGKDSILKTICVNPIPTAAFAVDTTIGCAPLTINTTTTANTPTCGSNKYNWTVTYNSTAGCIPSSGNYAYVNGTSSSSKDPIFLFNNPGVYTLSLVVISPSSACSTASIIKQITVKGKPNITSISNITSPICEGQSINPLPAITCYMNVDTSYMWSFSGGSPGSSLVKNPGQILYNTAGTYPVSLKAINACGDTTVTRQVVVNPTPNLTVPASSNFCSGTTVGPFTFTTTTPGTTINWTRTAGNIGLAATSGATNNIPSFTATNTGTTPITSTVTVTARTGTCTYQQTFSITVNPKPAKPVAVSPILYCLNAVAVPLAATASTGNNLTWYNNPQLTGGSTTAPTPSTSTSGTISYYVTQKNNFGCESDVTIINVTVSEVITGNIIGSDQTICSGTSPATLTGQGTPGGGSASFSYQWQQSTDNGINWNDIPGAFGVSYSPGTISATILYRRIINSGGCTDASAPVTITVSGSLTNFGISAPQIICEGQTPALLDGQTPTGGSGTFSYQWESSPNAVVWSPIPGATFEDYQPPALTTNMYYRRKVSSGPCGTIAPPVLITVNPKPNGSITAAPSICEDATGSVTFTGNAGQAPYTLTLVVTDANGVASAITQTVSSPATITVLPANSPVGNYSIVLTDITDNRGCIRSGAISTASIAVNPKPPVAVSPAGAICNGSSTILTASGATTYSWSPSTGLSASTGSSVTANPIVTTTYTVTGTANGCSNAASVIVTVNPKPVAPLATSPVTYCQNVTAASLTATALTGNTLTWYTTSALTNGSTTAPIPSTAVAGSILYYVTQTNSFNCESGPAIITVNVITAISGNTIGSDQAICSGATATALTQTSGSVTGGIGSYTYQWQLSTDNGNTWTNIPGATIALYAPGNVTVNTQYRRLINSGQCTSTSNVVTITAQGSFGNFDITAAQQICEATTPALLVGQPATGGNGVYNYQWESSLDNNNWTPITGATSKDFQPIALTTTTYYRRKVTSGICSAYSSVIKITVYQKPVAGAITPSPANACAGTSVTLTASSVTGNIKKWQYHRLPLNNANWVDTLVTSGSITFNNVQDTFAARLIVISFGAGQGCDLEDTTAAVMINVTTATIGGKTAASATVCSGNNSATITLTGNKGLILSWETSINSGASWSPVNNTTSSLTYTNITATTWYRVAVQNGTCPLVYSDTTKITVISGVTPANAGSDQKLCNASTATLNGNTPAIGTGNWTQTFGPLITIVSPALPQTNVTGLQPNTTYRFTWTITGTGQCPSSADEIEIINRPTVTVSNAGADITICNFVLTASAQLSANADVSRPFETGKWTIASEPSAGSGSFSNTSIPSSNFTVTRSGLYKLVWTISNDITTGCPATTDTVLMNVFDKPVAGIITASQTNVCAGSNITFTAAPQGFNPRWQYNPAPVNDNIWTDTTLPGSPVTFTNMLDTFAVRLVVTSLGGSFGCNSSDTSNIITVNVSPITKGGTTDADATVCTGTNTGTITLTANTGAILRWESSVNGTSWSPIINQTSALSYTNLTVATFYRVVVQSGACAFAYSDTTKILIAPLVTQANAGIDQLLCNATSTTLNGNAASNGETGTWKQLTGNPVNFSGTTISNPVIANLTPGKYSFEWQLSNGVCPPKKDTLLVEVLPDVTNIIDVAPKSICFGDSVTITGQPSTGGNGTYQYQWQQSSDNINWRNITGETKASLNFLPTNNIYFRRSVSSLPCGNISSVAYVEVKSAVGSFIASDTVASCFPVTISFKNTTLTNSIAAWHFSDGFDTTGILVSHTFTSPGTFTVTMVGQHPGGCRYTAIKTIIINGPSGTWKYDNGVICGSRPLKFEASVINVDSLKWNFGDGTSQVTTDRSIYHTYTQPGFYVPSVELISGVGASCRHLLLGTDTIKMDIIKAGFRIAMLKECGQTKVSFTDTSRAYSGLQQWAWSFGDGKTSIAQNPQTAYTSTNNWLVRLIVKSALGCMDTTSITFPIKVDNIPATTVVSNSIACTGEGVLYTANTISADVLQSTMWTFSNGITATTPSFTNVYAAPGTYNARFIATTAFGCADTVNRQIIINPTPTVKSIADLSICKGQSVQLNTTGAATFSWSPINALSCANCASPLATPLSTTIYEVTGSNGFGCSAKDTVKIIVNQPFKIIASPSDSLCTGLARQLTVSGAQRYKWFPSAGLSRDDIANPIAAPLISTRYMVVGYDTASCFTDTAYVFIGIGQIPTVNLGPDKVLSAGTLLPLTSVVTNGPITSWNWLPATDLNCNTCPIPIATIKKDISYSVKASNAFGCTASDTINIKVFCQSTQVFIPNLFTPDGDGLNDVLIVRGSGIKNIKTFRVFNRWGEVVFERSNFSPNEKSNGWDGTVRGVKAPPDVYVYTCEVLCENDQSFTYKGNVAIIK